MYLFGRWMCYAAKTCEKSTKGKKDDYNREPGENYFPGFTEA